MGGSSTPALSRVPHQAVRSPAGRPVPSYTGYLIETFVTLLAVCALALVVFWGARRLGVGRASGPIELFGHLPLDGRRAVYLIKVGSRVFIVGVAEGGFAKLGEIPADELPEVARLGRPSFASVFARSLAKRRPHGEARSEGE
jgi:flagellar biogenesis protein FliO